MAVAAMHDTAAPNVCVLASADIDQHADNLRRWNQEYDQLSAGHFYGRIDELALDKLQVFQEHTSRALHQHCLVWRNALWLGIPLRPADCRINGQSVAHDEVFCRSGGQGFELVTPADFDIYGVVIDREELGRIASIQGIDLSADAVPGERLRVPAQTLQGMRLVLGRMLHRRSTAMASRLQKDMVVMALMELLHNSAPSREVLPSYAHRKAVVDTVREHLKHDGDTLLTITQLCELTNVSRRTLQYSFETIIGISPHQFLAAIRLNQVRRALRQPDNRETITDIATYWGFLHLGQFAKDYRSLFGETPSQARERYRRQGVLLR